MTTGTTEDLRMFVGKIPVHLGDLTGPDGNAYVIMGRVIRNWHQYMWANTPHRQPAIQELLTRFEREALSGDYEHLLNTVLLYCDDLDGSVECLLADRLWEDDEDE